jgi:hypothetical protein
MWGKTLSTDKYGQELVIYLMPIVSIFTTDFLIFIDLKSQPYYLWIRNRCQRETSVQNL